MKKNDHLPASAIIADVDITTVYQQLLPHNSVYQRQLKRLLSRQPSCSGFILLLGIKEQNPKLALHNIFFSSNYKHEFEDIFNHQTPPREPTIYLTITSKSSPLYAPLGKENWFVLVNAPALSDQWDWEREADGYLQLVQDRFAQFGLDIRGKTEVLHQITPVEIGHLSAAWRGALYGASSKDRWAAFQRPLNRAPDLNGLNFSAAQLIQAAVFPWLLSLVRLPANSYCKMVI